MNRIILMVVLICASCIGAWAAQQYTVTDLGYGEARGINNIGQVVGGNASGAFLWTATGGMQNLGFGAVGINNNGQFVGSGYTGGQTHAMLWTGTGGSYVDLNPSGFSESTGEGISGPQQVGGGSGSATGGQSHALLWSGTAGSFVDLNPSGFTESGGYGISGTQQVGIGETVGLNYHALLWSGTAGSYVDLNPSGFWYSQAMGISGTQQVGFGLATGSQRHALLWSGTAESYVDLNPSGLTGSSGLGTNGTQQVGYGYGTTTRYSNHALLWSGTAGSYVDLNQFLPIGFLYSEAHAIDSRGDVVGYAEDSSGYEHAILWEPVTEPATLALTPNHIRINTSVPGGASASVTFTTALTAGSQPDSGTITFGDTSTTGLGVPLPSAADHTYTLGVGVNSQTFNASVSATNSGGTGNASASVTILRAPQVAVTVSGDQVTDGQHVTLFGPSVTLDLSGSQGYIENFSMMNIATGFSWTGQTWTGNVSNVFGASGVTFTVSNTGDGANTSLMNVVFLPQPGDANLDGVVNALDIDDIYNHIGPGNAYSQWDVNGDGHVNQLDVTCELQNILHTNYGDANLDSKTDFTDFQTLLDHWQVSNGGWAAGDFTGDGLADFRDFQMLLDYWNPGGWSFAPTQAPEPATLSLLALGGLALLRRRSRRRR